MFKIAVNVLFKDEILDPQGKTIHQNLTRIGFSTLEAVRVGKRFILNVNAKNREEALIDAEKIANKFLTNPVIEEFTLETIDEL